MAIFQKSVINKHLTNLDKEQVEKAYLKFKENYSPAKIEKIKQLKEEEYQDGFLRDLFVDVFGYTLKPNDNYNLVREFKNQADGKKADGAIIDNNGVYPVALAVIELKSTKTKDLKSITEQAFNYKNNQPDCKYVIPSNFQKLRFYIDYANEYEEFDLFYLDKENFELLYLILNTNSVFSDLPLKLKAETKFHEQEISGKLYKDYSNFKRKLFDNLTKNHPESNKLTLFKKSQKLLDRFLFILFAEDSGLLPPNSIPRIIKRYEILKDEDAYKPLYDIFKQYFGYMNIGRKGKTDVNNIPAYNGGLFFTDDLLDNLKIDDEILIDDLLKLSEYDFNTEVDVNILGHIFEHSLSEIEEITSEIEGTASDRTKSKRKKDGVFYSPKYITQYIVENTLGTLCNEKRNELEIEEIEFDGTYRTKDGKLLVKGKKLYQKLNNYKDWLLSLKIVDPACGSGAFLNQALIFLIQEHKNIDDIISELTNTALRLFDTDKAILENNLYGVDINEESVEIAKLSLWLRTAQKGRKLSVLSNNIKCGNSLIDDPEVAGDKAFDWNNEFPQIFKKKKKKAWHITTATHNSRYSQRMFDNHIKLGEAIWISEKDEIIVTETIAKIVKEDNLNVIAYNICGDHMHMLLVCEKEKLPGIVGKLKSVSGRKYNIEKGITIPATTEESEKVEGTEESEWTATRGHVPLSTSSKDVPLSKEEALSPEIVSSSNTGKDSGKKNYNSLWTQKFGKRKITDDNDLRNVINYILTNRQKHELPENKKLEKIISKMTCSIEHAFRSEYNGGFDVVIGNPPYVNANDLKKYLSDKEYSFLKNNYITAKGTVDLYIYFFEKGLNILNIKGLLSFITPNRFLSASYGKALRKYLIEECQIISLIDYSDKSVFPDASTYPVISFLKQNFKLDYEILTGKFDEITKQLISKKVPSTKLNILDDYILGFLLNDKLPIVEKIINNSVSLENVGKINATSTASEADNYSKIINNKSGYKLINTGTIDPYVTTWGFCNLIDKGAKHKTPYLPIENNIISKNRHKLYSSPKIIISKIGLKCEAFYDKEGKYASINTNCIHSFDDKFIPEYILCWINSQLYNYLFECFFDGLRMSGGYLLYSAPNLRNTYVKQITNESQQPFIEKADKMLSLNQQLQEKKTRFLNRVKDNLAKTVETRGHDPLANDPLANDPLTITIKISKKLDAFYNYDFKTFIGELKKQKINLSLVQQDEWEEYFNAYKTEINNLQSEINKTDKEIDQMVYELYGLTEEEIKIVEGAV